MVLTATWMDRGTIYSLVHEKHYPYSEQKTIWISQIVMINFLIEYYTHLRYRKVFPYLKHFCCISRFLTCIEEVPSFSKRFSKEDLKSLNTISKTLKNLTGSFQPFNNLSIVSAETKYILYRQHNQQNQCQSSYKIGRREIC